VRAHRSRHTDSLRLLWWIAAIEAGRGRHQNAGNPTPLQGDRDGAREIQMLRLRGERQLSALFHATSCGFMVPNLLATIVSDEFEQHIPLKRQSTRFRCEHRSVDPDARRSGRRPLLFPQAAIEFENRHSQKSTYDCSVDGYLKRAPSSLANELSPQFERG